MAASSSNSGERDPVNCPICRGAMLRVNAGDMEVDRCAGCHGLWFDMLELERLPKLAPVIKSLDRKSHTASPKPKRPRSLLCPRDHSTLIEMVDARQPHIHYESCKLCGGVFLDTGELTDLSEYTLLERLGWKR